MVGIEGKITWRKNLMKYKEYKELCDEIEAKNVF